LIVAVSLDSLGSNLLRLLNDSDKIFKAVQDGELGARIDQKQYLGGFSQIVKNINQTMGITSNVLRDVGNTLYKLSKGDLETRIINEYSGDFNVLKATTNSLGNILSINDKVNRKQNWIKSGVVALSKELSGHNTIDDVSQKAIGFVCNYLSACVGVVYSYDEKMQILTQSGSYALTQRDDILKTFKLGEGTIGQVATQKSPIVLKNSNKTNLIIETGFASVYPTYTYTAPLVYNDKLFGVIEIGMYEELDNYTKDFLEQANNIIATALSTSIASKEVRTLLEETQRKNIRLEQQQQMLEEKNIQLEQQQQQLKQNAKVLKEKNDELDEKARALELSNKYKSEFLANMSHELRTPLNSIILLSEMLMENKDGRFDKNDVKKAYVINSSAKELLKLVSDILDLSKIESGKVDVVYGNIESKEFLKTLTEQFNTQAQNKGLNFIVEDKYEGVIRTDIDKLSQIVNNFVSNAIKFTENGFVKVVLGAESGNKIKISVEDSGIGIDSDKLGLIFDAFRQAEGGVDRRFGGTGLGLSIAKRMAEFLGGKIVVSSIKGEGSTFSVVIPNKFTEGEKKDINSKIEPKPKIEANEDDRDIVTVVDKPFLLVSRDENLKKALKNYLSKAKEYILIAKNSFESLRFAEEYNIKGIIVDMESVKDGVDLLKKLKTDRDLKELPIYIVGAADSKLNAFDGIGCSKKPISDEKIVDIIKSLRENYESEYKKLELTDRKVLIADDDIRNVYALSELLSSKEAVIFSASNGKEAIDVLREHPDIDIVLMDIMMPVMDGYEATKIIKENEKTKNIPVIAVTAKAMSDDRKKALDAGCDDYLAKPIKTNVLVNIMRAWIDKNKE
jgi:signal transduction histidine kinase/CheY-like chemotaxis protein